jgi:ABC-type oligopeptide transport system substrate-binding subunit
VGTGPYALQTYLQDQRLIFVANPAYRGRPDVDGDTPLPPDQRLPKIKRVQYDYYKELIPVWYLFREKLYDVAVIPKESFDQAIDKQGNLVPDLKEQGVILQKTPEASMYYWGFNMTDPVVGKNKALRHAMSMAYDRQKFVRIYRNGRGIPLNGPIPPGFECYDPKAVNPYTTYNVSAARELMKEAERINGGPIPPLRLLMQDSDTDSRQYADFFIAQMQEIGLKLEADFPTWARYQEMVDNRQTQVFASGWAADYPDEQTYLMLFYGKNAPALGVNSTAYVNPAFDELYEKASLMDRSPQRLELYKKMIAIVDEDCPWIYDFCPIRFDLQYNWLTPYTFMDYGGGYRQFLELDVAKRQRAFGK